MIEKYEINAKIEDNCDTMDLGLESNDYCRYLPNLITNDDNEYIDDNFLNFMSLENLDKNAKLHEIFRESKDDQEITTKQRANNIISNNNKGSTNQSSIPDRSWTKTRTMMNQTTDFSNVYTSTDRLESHNHNLIKNSLISNTNYHDYKHCPKSLDLLPCETKIPSSNHKYHTKVSDGLMSYEYTGNFDDLSLAQQSMNQSEAFNSNPKSYSMFSDQYLFELNDMNSMPNLGSVETGYQQKQQQQQQQWQNDYFYVIKNDSFLAKNHSSCCVADGKINCSRAYAHPSD